LAIWGPIAGVIGIEASLWTACGLLVTSALALLAVPEIRRLPAFPPPDRDPRGQLHTRPPADAESAVSHTRGG
jgi:hypothetical protein